MTLNDDEELSLSTSEKTPRKKSSKDKHKKEAAKKSGKKRKRAPQKEAPRTSSLLGDLLGVCCALCSSQ